MRTSERASLQAGRSVRSEEGTVRDGLEGAWEESDCAAC